MKKIITLLLMMTLYTIFMPKKLTKIEIYAASFFALFYGKTVDEILDIKKNLYGYIGKGVDYLGVMMQIIIYPTVSLLFLNYFPFRRKLLKQLLYILGWSIFSISFEQLSKRTKIFYYKKWKWWYSALLYPFIFASLIINLLFFRRLIKGVNWNDLLRGQEAVLK